MRQQRGFTLLELMVAMVIFAALAISGWQVFDSVNRARERAQLQADNLAVLQYAYLQLQQDMGQVIAYQAASSQNSQVANNANNNNNNSNNNANDTNNDNPAADEQAAAMPEPFMSLSNEQVSFMRYADPDPRYQTSPSIQRVEYLLSDQRLIRRQYTNNKNESIGLDSVLLEGVTEVSWQAYLPEPVSKFPDADSQNSPNGNNSLGQANNTSNKPKVRLLPRGVSLSFTYQQLPITWQFALAAQPAPNTSKAKSDDVSNGNGSNNNNNNSNNGSNDNNDNNGSNGSNGSNSDAVNRPSAQ
ncbi:type II secretion system protein GspJ [Psychrobacter sp. BF1]|uniref:type II secretion system protein GspJ n=1 Tax=Psychrobacter sp. BF1 TaxID=2821147 RepID=UPI001C4DF004